MAVVPPGIAQECMQYFDTIMNGSDLGPIRQSFSSSVTFETPEFAAWLIDNKYLESTTTIRISFGIYTVAAAEQLHIPELAGRLTAFVWPINNEEEKPPFNLGETSP